MAKNAKPVAPKATTETQAQSEAPKAQPTKDELLAQLKAAMSKGDWKEIAKVSRQIDNLVKSAEKAELEAKKAAVAAMESVVKDAIMSSVTELMADGKLDAAEGIWFSYDFGDKDATVRLLKTQTKTRTGGGGTGKKFDISTEAMLEKHGAEEYKDGMTFKAAYDSNTDKNWRYAIRQKLLKLEGIIS